MVLGIHMTYIGNAHDMIWYGEVPPARAPDTQTIAFSTHLLSPCITVLRWLIYNLCDTCTSYKRSRRGLYCTYANAVDAETRTAVASISGSAGIVGSYEPVRCKTKWNAKQRTKGAWEHVVACNWGEVQLAVSNANHHSFGCAASHRQYDIAQTQDRYYVRQ